MDSPLGQDRLALLDSAPLCAAVLDADGKPIGVNRVFTELMGPLFKFSGYPFSEAASQEEGKEQLRQAFSAVRSGTDRLRLRNVEMLTLGGESGLPVKTHFDWFIGPGGGAGEVTIYGDPCTAELLEQREKDAELIDFFQNAPIALHWLSGTGHVMWANQTELDVLGYTAEEYIGQPIMKFCPDEEELVLEIFKTLGSGNIIKDVPVRFRTKAGKIVPLLIDSNVAYTVDEHGEKAFNHTRCFIRDDTGRRVREARTEALLKEAERSLKMLDAFVSRTLHLIKTPCHIVQQSLGLLDVRLRGLQARLPASELKWFDDTKNLVEGAATQLMEVTEMITDASDVMRFEQGAVMQLVESAVPLAAVGQAVCDHAKTLLGSQGKPRTVVRFECGEGPQRLNLDSRVLHRALNHLLANAVEATPDGGTITLRVAHTAAQPASGEQGDDAARRAGVRFEVHDTGRGLPDATDVFQRYSPGVSPVASPLTSPQLGGGGGGGNAEAAAAERALRAVEKTRAGIESQLTFTNAKKGLGFGLNLTYGLVRSLGGELRFRSAEGGGNTAFSFEVPAAAAGEAVAAAKAYVAQGAAPAPSAAKKPSASGWGNSMRLNNWDSTPSAADLVQKDEVARPDGKVATPPQSTGATEQVTTPPPEITRDFVEEKPWTKVVEASCVANTGLRAMEMPHVLVVDDTAVCADVIRMLLKQLGCSSDHASDGVEALEKLMFVEPGLYSLVLMDLRMPKKDGFDATRAIKQMGMDVPVVALTADDSTGTRAQCKEIGFDGFATKPLLADDLAALLEKHVGHKMEHVIDAQPDA